MSRRKDATQLPRDRLSDTADNKPLCDTLFSFIKTPTRLFIMLPARLLILVMLFLDPLSDFNGNLVVNTEKPFSLGLHTSLLENAQWSA